MLVILYLKLYSSWFVKPKLSRGIGINESFLDFDILIDFCMKCSSCGYFDNTANMFGSYTDKQDRAETVFNSGF